jgi:hypothetical protein
MLHLAPQVRGAIGPEETPILNPRRLAIAQQVLQ